MIRLIFTLLTFLSFSANAHVAPETGGVFTGILHPITGVDHFMAMLLVGMFSVALGNKHTWLVPAAFMIAMVVGAFLALNSVRLILVEFAIAASVFVLGASVYFKIRPVLWVGYLGVALFGLFHGYAHGSEIPRLMHPTLFIGGFVIGTGLIHLLGVFICLSAEKIPKLESGVRFLGAAFCGIGAYLTAEYFPLMVKLAGHYH